MPSPASLRSSMPALWPAELQALLPAPAHALLRKQQRKLESDLLAVSDILLPEYAKATGRELDECKKEYVQGWLLVNSRCFYWDYPVLGGKLKGKLGAAGVGAKKRARDGRMMAGKRERDDCMAMCPVMDYFNHADGDGVSFLDFAIYLPLSGFAEHGFALRAMDTKTAD